MMQGLLPRITPTGNDAKKNNTSVTEQALRPEYGVIKTDDCSVIGFGMEINGFLC